MLRMANTKKSVAKALAHSTFVPVDNSTFGGGKIHLSVEGRSFAPGYALFKCPTGGMLTIPSRRQ
jgi:hypothetical protein